MKSIQLFILRNCPHCQLALRELADLQKNDLYKPLKIELIDESEHPEIANQFDYYYVPTFYVDGVKVHEGKVTHEIVESVLKKATA